ncbi:hypothetical protein [Tuwongella immobilis]|uniref:Uncharacterized protein n=1 Tax=Tuwongella immobilis TaxID=692036 RepID=A0A6C2YJL1_9BACT|nr:hypothetical protein [Tuwongella immobilis]VIP01760.1 Uncharacterized protein OS=Catenulispora acidiphila (strain DSM 44928 / NRRL B-24433 / NBRC 102108 / JCM 14897) GN=Caci_3891 PE=4 SV=1 [Tuwongella immobilis]VTR99367.1 Uncharacterized protein OS=Catenulispora acidiphila (strain DSM 44928 / NRRL B-24433 / NBRC 102108 / JCM 14897) GN=Caci_3891 PE=4 SV=1 [Tuwongella immobilis]
MSDTVVKVIPADPRYVPPAAVHQPALDLLIRLAPRCEDPSIRVHRKVQYVDAGEYEEGATCPHCGQHLVFNFFVEDDPPANWYREIVHQTELHAEGVPTVMPCCGAEVPFEEVRFDSSGFARFELIVSNPDTPYPLPDGAMRQLEAVVGCPLRQVWARY